MLLVAKGGERVEVSRDDFVNDLFTEEALGFIRRHQAEPFFLYLAYQFPHGPYKPHDSLQNEAFAEEHGLKGNVRVYASQVIALPPKGR